MLLASHEVDSSNTLLFAQPKW